MNVTVETVETVENIEYKTIDDISDAEILKRAEVIKQKKLKEVKQREEQQRKIFIEEYQKIYNENITLKKHIEETEKKINNNILKSLKLRQEYSKICPHEKCMDQIYFNDGKAYMICKYCDTKVETFDYYYLQF